MRHEPYHLLLAPLLSLLAACAGSGSRGTPTSPTFDEASYRAHIERLSSDAFEGRAPRTGGEQRTVEYIEQQFRAAGLEPGFGGSYRQEVPLVEITTHADPAMELRGAA